MGGGVAAVEALLALHELVGPRVAIELVSAAPDFVFRPLTVAEPFGLAPARRIPLADIAREHNAQLRLGTVEEIDTSRRALLLHGDRDVAYDELLVAVGARAQPWLEGAVSFAGSADADGVRRILRELERGTVMHVAFAAPPSCCWVLPLYELALLSAAWLAERRAAGVRLAVHTPEREPLELFGEPASRLVRELMANRGITFHGGAAPSSADIAERVIALPQLVGRALPGLPADEHGFIPVDAHQRVRGVEHVHAAGDGTAFKIKQGGLAAQQADAAAESIAAALGAPVDPRPFRPTLRGELLTGLAPAYLSARRVSAARGSEDAVAGFTPLWSPPGKVAGTRLAPYLDGREGETLGDRPAPAADLPTQLADHEEARELLLALAESEAAWGDYRAALRDLEALERIEGVLPEAYAAKRAEWEAHAAGGA